MTEAVPEVVTGAVTDTVTDPAFEPIDGTDATILGKVTAVLRRV